MEPPSQPVILLSDLRTLINLTIRTIQHSETIPYREAVAATRILTNLLTELETFYAKPCKPPKQ